MISKMIEERSSNPNLRKTISEPQMRIEPAAFWWPVRHSNHWVTEARMPTSDASSTYVLRKKQLQYVDNDI